LYTVNTTNNPNFFKTVNVFNNGATVSKPATSLNATYITQVGRDLSFSLRISDFLAANPAYYFDRYGQTISPVPVSGLTSGAKYISTTLRVNGANIGHTIDIPVVLAYQP